VYLLDTTNLVFKDGYVLSINLSASDALELLDTLDQIKGWNEHSGPSEQ
jgi:hypothetical protein